MSYRERSFYGASDMKEDIRKLEKRVEMLENMIGLLVKNNKPERPERTYRPRYNKYVLVTDDVTGIQSYVYSLEACARFNAKEMDNVTYLTLVPDTYNNAPRTEIVVITENFFKRWKNTHYGFTVVSYSELSEILKLDGIIKGCDEV